MGNACTGAKAELVMQGKSVDATKVKNKQDKPHFGDTVIRLLVPQGVNLGEDGKSSLRFIRESRHHEDMDLNEEDVVEEGCLSPGKQAGDSGVDEGKWKRALLGILEASDEWSSVSGGGEETGTGKLRACDAGGRRESACGVPLPSDSCEECCNDAPSDGNVLSDDKFDNALSDENALSDDSALSDDNALSDNNDLSDDDDALCDDNTLIDEEDSYQGEMNARLPAASWAEKKWKSTGTLGLIGLTWMHGGGRSDEKLSRSPQDIREEGCERTGTPPRRNDNGGKHGGGRSVENLSRCPQDIRGEGCEGTRPPPRSNDEGLKHGGGRSEENLSRCSPVEGEKVCQGALTTSRSRGEDGKQGRERSSKSLSRSSQDDGDEVCEATLATSRSNVDQKETQLHSTSGGFNDHVDLRAYEGQGSKEDSLLDQQDEDSDRQPTSKPDNVSNRRQSALCRINSDIDHSHPMYRDSNSQGECSLCNAGSHESNDDLPPEDSFGDVNLLPDNGSMNVSFDIAEFESPSCNGDASAYNAQWLKLSGEVDDCNCKVESVSTFNNLRVYPRVNSLVATDYFKFFRVNLNKPCPFWPDDGACAMRSCAVCPCTDDQVPCGLKDEETDAKKYTEQLNTVDEEDVEEEDDGNCESRSEEEIRLSALDTTISKEREAAFQTWKEHDDAQFSFCELDDEYSAHMEYVDLTLNPERYTGYKGASPHRIWNSIYNENCFKPDPNTTGYQSLLTNKQVNKGLCLEKRVFYRLISGLHSSINIHLCADYLFAEEGPFGGERWGPNVDEFKLRFDPETSDGEGPTRLKNLYFTYLVMLRAIAKATPLLKQESFYTGNEADDADVKQAVLELLGVIQSFNNHFNESLMFQGNSVEASQLKEEFRSHFWNISRIMDCVGCDKCKLWGKLQIQGLGAALKILFTDKKHSLRLSRQEIVTLIVGFSKLSNSIIEVENFQQRIEDESKSGHRSTSSTKQKMSSSSPFV